MFWFVLLPVGVYGKFGGNTADAKDIAVVHVGVGDRDKAFEWLEKAYSYRSFHMTTILIDPLLDDLHADPRWEDLKRRVGITG